MKEGKLSRKEREFSRHRQEILDAALILFSKKGFHSVTMQEIANASEFAVGTIYKFFTNKENIYEALIFENYDNWHFSLMDAIGKKDEMESIRRYLNTHISLFIENTEFVRLYYAETRGGSFNIRPGLRQELKERHEQILMKLEKLFERGIRKQLFKKFDPHNLAIVLEAVTHAFSRQYFETRDENSFDAEMIMKIFFESVIRN